MTEWVEQANMKPASTSIEQIFLEQFPILCIVSRGWDVRFVMTEYDDKRGRICLY